ncbi:MAG: zinc ribbon domain-containing protein [Blastocatellia bacterium]|nr:zinc ribbon domain-containing protein [Blastocatellia bacterium]
MTMIRFTANHDDISNSNGFQFKFYCDKCHNGYQTRFQPMTGNTVSGILRSAESFLGGIFGQAANSIDRLQDTFKSSAHDTAFGNAVEEAQQYFKQCTRCGKWVCPQICWNPQHGLCKDCAPQFQEERSAAQAQGARHQLHNMAHWQVPLASASDLQNNAPATCPNCNSPNTGGRFCSECGAAVQEQKSCPGCNKMLQFRAKYCPDCGTRIPAWNI